MLLLMVGLGRSLHRTRAGLKFILVDSLSFDKRPDTGPQFFKGLRGLAVREWLVFAKWTLIVVNFMA